MIQPFNLLSFVVSFTLSGFAVYYTATMLAEGEGLFDVFTKWRTWVKEKLDDPYQVEHRGHRHWFYAGITCPRCLSLWLALLPTTLLYLYFLLDPFQFVLVWFGIAGLSRWLYSFE